MANPLKVLTQLSASKEAQFAEVVEMQKTVTVSGGDLRYTNAEGEISGSGAFKNAGAAQLGSTLAVTGDANLAAKLDVKGDSALSGALGVVGVATLQDQIVVAGAADFNSSMDVQGDLNLQSDLDVAGYVKVIGELSGSAALNIGGQSHFVDNAQFDAELNVDGAVDMDSTLNVAGNITAQASASIAGDLDVDGLADIAGDLGVHGNAVIYGNLEVKGMTTTIESTTVTVADANIQLATVASPTDSTADGAGITILGTFNKTFQWNNDGHGFTSSENMNLAGGNVYKIDGQEVLAKDGLETTLSFAGGTANVAVSSTAVSIDGDLELSDDLHVLGDLDIDGASNFDGVATFASDVTASANLDVAGNVHIAGGKLEIDRVGDFAMVELDGFAAIYANSSNELAIADGAFTIHQTSGVAIFSSDLSASAGLDVVGNAHIAGQLDVDQAADLGSTLDVAGVASFAADITASANVDVAGDVRIQGGKLEIDADAGIASIYLDGLPAIYSNPLNELDIGDGALLINRYTYASTFSADITASAGLDVAAAAHFAAAVDMGNTLNVVGQADFQDAANFHGNVAMDAALNLSGSAFINITTPVVAGKYNVNDAIRALDDKAGQQANNINSNYA